MHPHLVLHRSSAGTARRRTTPAAARGRPAHALASQGALDRITALAGEALNVAAVFASLVDADRRLLTSSYGIPVPLALLLSHTFRKQVVASRQPLIVDDGLLDAAVADNPAVRDGTVRACVGMPLDTWDGHPVGSLLVMDREPRAWTAADLGLVRKASALIVSEMELSAAVRQASPGGSTEPVPIVERPFIERRSSTRWGDTTT